MRIQTVPRDGTVERQHRKQIALAVNALIGANAQSLEYGALGSPLLWVDAGTYTPGALYDGATFSFSGTTWRCMGTGSIGSGNFVSFFVRTN